MVEVTRFEQCLIDAERAKQVKRKAAKKLEWKAENIFDLEDILDALAQGGGIRKSKGILKAMARRIFRSLSSNPHQSMIDIPMGQPSEGMDVPKTAILNILQSALQGFDKSLTKRQQQAAEAYDEAIHLGITPSAHVAATLGINRHSAYKLIKRSNLETFHGFVDYMYSSVYQIDEWSPSPKQVQAMMKSKPRTCAYCGVQPSTNGAMPLCFKCHSLIGMNEREWDNLTRGWLPAEIKRLRSEHRLWAVDQCYKAHCGIVSIEEYEFMVNAI